jgi:lauroyl/myristoyl acyltransferase
MASSGLVAKIALHRAGFLITHLSRNEHGWGGSRFARAVLNPIVTRVEERHVAERLVMSPDDSFHALRTLVRRVRENNLVSMTVGSGGPHSYAVPLLNGTLRVADGAPVLARNTGAALLPVFTERREDGAYTVTVEKPLRISVDEDRSEAARAAVVELAKRLEPYVIARPDQYPAWDW